MEQVKQKGTGRLIPFCAHNFFHTQKGSDWYTRVPDAMPKCIWIDSALLFKREASYTTQCRCVCAEDYRRALHMDIGDIVFTRDPLHPRWFQRLGRIKAICGTKVIIEFMPPLRSASKKTLLQHHHWLDDMQNGEGECSTE
jgi:hypothetical protein